MRKRAALARTIVVLVLGVVSLSVAPVFADGDNGTENCEAICQGVHVVGSLSVIPLLGPGNCQGDSACTRSLECGPANDGQMNGFGQVCGYRGGQWGWR